LNCPIEFFRPLYRGKFFWKVFNLFFRKRAFNGNFEIAFGCTLGNVGNTCEFDAKFEGYFVDVGNVSIIRFFEGINGIEG